MAFLLPLTALFGGRYPGTAGSPSTTVTPSSRWAGQIAHHVSRPAGRPPGGS